MLRRDRPARGSKVATQAGCGPGVAAPHAEFHQQLWYYTCTVYGVAHHQAARTGATARIHTRSARSPIVLIVHPWNRATQAAAGIPRALADDLTCNAGGEDHTVVAAICFQRFSEWAHLAGERARMAKCFNFGTSAEAHEYLRKVLIRDPYCAGMFLTVELQFRDVAGHIDRILMASATTTNA